MGVVRITIELPEELWRRAEAIGVTVEEIRLDVLAAFERHISLKEASQHIPRDAEATAVNDIMRLAEYCRNTLNLSEVKISEEYGYAHLALCLIDAIFSISVNYAATTNTVKRFCTFVGTSRLSSEQSQDDSPFTISDLLELYRKYSLEFVTTTIYQNRQRTSSRNGILKSEAVLRAAEVLQHFGANTLDDFQGLAGNSAFEKSFRAIPGQKSGISLRYLYMLTGTEDLIKPDRMILRFIEAAIGRPASIDECQPLLVQTCQILAIDFPQLTPRKLDNLIWQYQRTQ